MKNQVYLITLLLWIGSILISCEKEKIEYKKTWDGHNFIGFKDGLFIVHDNSVGYYYPDSNKVFPDIFAHQNGWGLGTGVHSFDANAGMITVENENKIEFVDLENFISIGSIEINRPRNIAFFGSYRLVSFGDRVSGGVALVDYNRDLMQMIPTGNEAGKIYTDGSTCYVFCSGKDENDSIIAILDREFVNSVLSLRKVDSIVVGIKPVDFLEISLNFDSQHNGLAILCMGNQSVPASVVIFDLNTRKVQETYTFAKSGFKPESMFWIGEPYTGSRKLAVYADGKLYQTELSNPMVTSVLIDKNVSDFYRYDQTYLAVSRDTISPVSYLYKFDVTTLDLIDSIPIEGKAKKIEGTIHASGQAEW